MPTGSPSYDRRMERPRRLVLVRHAESARQQAKKDSTYFADDEARRTVRDIANHKIELTPLGVAQARATGIDLRERFGAFDHVYDSGYQRAVQTAEHILHAYTEEERAAMPVRHNIFIRERDPGYAYDMTAEEAEAAFPWL